MKKSVRELSGAELDYWVAKAEGATDDWRGDGPFFWDNVPAIRFEGHDVRYRPSSSWIDGGPIIDKHDIFFERSIFPDDGAIFAHYDNDECGQFGPDRLTAAMRLVVFTAFGEEVEV